MTPIVIWALLVGASFRLQRIVTKDDWPPSQWFRRTIAKRYGQDSSTFDFFTCPWCFGFWVTLAVFTEHYLFGFIPLWLYAAFAASATVGLIAERLDN